MKYFYLPFFIFFICLNAFGQEEHDHDHKHHEHKNEIALATSYVRFISEDENTLGLHLHFIKNITEGGLGVGVGYERLFDEHGHNNISAVLNYRIREHLSVALAPGLTFEDEDTGLKPAIHFEFGYEWEFGDFHVGPMVEYAIDTEDNHLSLGIHVGIGF